MQTKPIRFGALDVFRGITIIFMIIVNSPGNWSFVYGPLLHAEWHGFTPTDLVFPSFLFAVGTAMSFAMRKWSDLSGSEAGLKILKRTALLFLFGYLMYWYPFFRLDLAWNFSAFPIGDTRIFGVLQRIALAYGVAAALLHFAGKKWTYALVLLSLPVYWFLLVTYGIEGLDPLSLEGNAVRALDLKLIGANHMYMGEGIAFDPEGLLTTLPSIANIIAGYAAGLFVQRDRNEKNTRIDLMLLGASLCLVALVWNLAFPINKKLWTSSYALLTIGLDLVILGLLMWFLPKDKKLPGWGTFFQTAGKNPLAIYLLSELALITLYTLPAGTSSAWEWAYTNGFSWMGAKLGSFAMAAVFSLSCWAFGYWMDRRKWYWRV